MDKIVNSGIDNMDSYLLGPLNKMGSIIEIEKLRDIEFEFSL